MDISIIIVNWNSRDYLRKCLDSVPAGIKGLEFEIVVIDSASFDGCAQMLRKHYPEVRFIQSDRNLGFARANNAAFLASTGNCVLFLNPDTELRGLAINLMREQLLALPDAGVVGCKLLNSDGTVQTSCIKSFPTLLNQFLDAELLRKLFPRSRLWGMSALLDNSDASAEVEVVSGACMMLRRLDFERIGMFTTDYFMYSEDVDLCLKSRKAGLKNYCVLSAVVVHHGGGSSAGAKHAPPNRGNGQLTSDAEESRTADRGSGVVNHALRNTAHASRNTVSHFSSVMMLESRWRFFLRNRAAWYGWSYRAGMCGVSLFRIALTVLSWPYGIFTCDCARWRHAAGKWFAGLRWALGLERWVRNY